MQGIELDSAFNNIATLDVAKLRILPLASLPERVGCHE